MIFKAWMPFIPDFILNMRYKIPPSPSKKYCVAKRDADRHCIHIYNVMHEEQLEVFERVSLEEVLS
jgi:hypothetical protein